MTKPKSTELAPLNSGEMSAFDPGTFAEAWNLAEMMAASSFVPKPYLGKKEDCFLAMMAGNAVGLPPIQALQSIAVVNGYPSLWGDGALAVVMAHPEYVDIREWFEGSEGELVAKIELKRKGRSDCLREFSVEDAKRAGLLGKDNYKHYLRRMLQMRARSWAMRDQFPDALRGLKIREEAEDLPSENLDPEKEIPEATVSVKDKIRQNRDGEEEEPSTAPDQEETASETEPAAEETVDEETGEVTESNQEAKAEPAAETTGIISNEDFVALRSKIKETVFEMTKTPQSRSAYVEEVKQRLRDEFEVHEMTDIPANGLKRAYETLNEWVEETRGGSSE